MGLQPAGARNKEQSCRGLQGLPDIKAKAAAFKRKVKYFTCTHTNQKPFSRCLEPRRAKLIKTTP